MAPKNMLGGVTACISYTEKRGLPGLWEENCLWKAPRNMKDTGAARENAGTAGPDRSI